MSASTGPGSRRTAGVSLALLALVVSVALLPNLGLVSAQSNCLYNCVSSTPGPNYTPYYIALGVLVLLAILLGALLFMRRRRGGGAGPGPLTEASAADAPMEGPSGPDGPTDAPVEDVAAPVAAAAIPAGAAASYLEGPEDVGAVPPSAAAPAASATEAGGEADIDSLMKELDKISGEILKRPASKKDAPSPSDDEGADTPQ